MTNSILAHKIEEKQGQAGCLLKGNFKPEEFIIDDGKSIENTALRESHKPEYFEKKYFASGQLVISGYLKEPASSDQKKH